MDDAAAVVRPIERGHGVAERQLVGSPDSCRCSSFCRKTLPPRPCGFKRTNARYRPSGDTTG